MKSMTICFLFCLISHHSCWNFSSVAFFSSPLSLSECLSQSSSPSVFVIKPANSGLHALNHLLKVTPFVLLLNFFGYNSSKSPNVSLLMILEWMAATPLTCMSKKFTFHSLPFILFDLHSTTRTFVMSNNAVQLYKVELIRSRMQLAQIGRLLVFNKAYLKQTTKI